MSIEKIVITGGPCAGKSTALSRIQEHFSQLGYTVLVVAEVATELIKGGIAPANCDRFQNHLLKMQLQKEQIYEAAAKEMTAEKILIVCDRGALDNKAYMTQKAFSDALDELGTNEIALRDNYGAVFHLVTAAKGAADFYTLQNNSARLENPQKAAEIDDKLIAAWTGHPHFRVIDNCSDFDEKIHRLLVEISSYLGEPEPFEIERKFLIEYPDISWLEKQPNCQRVEIIQTYLNSPNGDEVRVRQRGIDGNYIYFKTTKRKISDIKRVEIEKRLSQDEYLRLLMDADTSRRQIRKTRYCFAYENCYLEIDVYPFWSDKAILEIELSDENAPICVPEQIHIIKEVTDDDSYKNASLARIDNKL